jgi:NAD-dependent dihydropyrimidine dehydrogenase PreA subunit
MSKNWYPVIDYENCTECGACYDKCTHGVYDREGDKNIVIQPESCIENCRGCQELCPSEAISYFGDRDNGIPGTCGCSCGGDC